MIEIWNPNSSDKFGIHYCLESGIHGDESRQSWIPLHETKKINQFFFLLIHWLLLVHVMHACAS